MLAGVCTSCDFMSMCGIEAICDCACSLTCGQEVEQHRMRKAKR